MLRSFRSGAVGRVLSLAVPSLAVLSLAGAAGASAQASPEAAQAPSEITQAPPEAAHAPRETRGGPAGEFDFYVLALSWSPAYCELEGNHRDRDQCEPGRGLGFVVHGLWPQFERGYPTECGPFGRSPSRVALAEAGDVFPSEGLARNQCRKHGSCSGKS